MTIRKLRRKPGFKRQFSLPQDVPSTSDRRLIELKNQVQRLMEAHLAPKSSVQVNKITSSCEICSGPHDTQYCMENPEQAFVDYASSRTDEAGVTEECKKSEEEGKEERGDLENINTNPPSPPDPSISFITRKDFMIVEDISSIIDPRLSEVVLGKPFVEISNMTHDLSLGVVKFINGTNEIAYKMPHKIEQYNSLSKFWGKKDSNLST
ncbi:hypothetical protein Tco_1078776 [Tanacetum coccineum]|uniref:MAK10-like protein n=1 Tax=Tanacetum coccineum TaxID=301880 RepID=A0ABQ5HPY4_9ASTR